MNTDPIADMLTRIRNANTAKHSEVKIPSSNLKLELAKLLKSEGYIVDYTVDEDEKSKFKMIKIALKYDETGAPVISNLQRISKPGLRSYKKTVNLPKVFDGLGIAIISTSKGLLTDRKARKENVGGEVLCYVW
jgi:small subunit ribosomal protein S8